MPFGPTLFIRSRIALLAAIFILVAGCDELDSVGSGTVLNGTPEVGLEIQMLTTIDFDLTTTGNEVVTTSVGVKIRDYSIDSDGMVIHLEEGDTLTATANFETIDLTIRDETEAEPVYTGQFSTDMSGQTVFVSLRKVSAPPGIEWFPTDDSPAPNFYYIDAQNTSVDLPASFTVTSPVYAINDPVNQSDDTITEFQIGIDSVDINWTPSGFADDFRMFDSAQCQGGSAGGELTITDDPGTVTFTADDFLFQTAPTGENCLIGISMLRETTTGTIDPVLSSKTSVLAQYQRTIFIRYIPGS